MPDEEEKRIILLPPSKELTKSSIAGREGLYTEMVKRGFKKGFVKKAHVSVMLRDAYSILEDDFHKLRAKAETSDEGLSLAEAAKMAKLVDALTKLAKEEREQLKEDGIPDLTDEELKDELKRLLEEANERFDK